MSWEAQAGNESRARDLEKRATRAEAEVKELQGRVDELESELKAHIRWAETKFDQRRTC